MKPIFRPMVDRVLARAGYLPLLRKTSVPGLRETTSTADPRLAAFFANYTYSGKNVTQESALQQATVWTCTRGISESWGMLPGYVYEVQKNGDAVKVDHDVGAVLFQSPNEDMTRVEFVEAGGANLCLAGNWFNYRNATAGGIISSLYPLPAQNVQKKRDPDGTVWFNILDRGKWSRVERDKIWHVPGFSSDGFLGYSPIGQLRQMIGTALATEEMQARFFSNGAMPSWLISIPEWLEDNQRKTAKENLQELWAGTTNAYRVQLLEGGMTATSATMPLEDAQFMELRGMSREEIMGAYRYPQHMGGKLDRATNNNIEQQALEFVMYCLMPYLTRMEASVSKYLFKPAERRRFFVRFDVTELLRADSVARGDFYAIMADHGIMARNEIRTREGLNRSTDPAMDSFTVQQQMIPIGSAATLAQRQATAPQTPAQVQLPPSKTGDTISNFTVALPDAVKHEMHHRHVAPEFREALDTMRDSVVQAGKSDHDLREAIAHLTYELRRTNEESSKGITNLLEHMGELKDLQFMDREAEVDGIKITSRLKAVK